MKFVSRAVVVRLALFGIIVFAGSGAWGQSLLAKEKIVFAPASGGSEASLNFKGRMFTKKNGPKIDEKSRDRFAEFMYRVIEVNKGTDVNNVMDVWAPGERARLLELMGNQAALERNRALFLNIRSSRLVGVIEYGSFYLVYVLHDLVGVGDYVKLYPVTEHDKKLFLSNGLVDDFFYSVIAEQIIGYQWPKK